MIIRSKYKTVLWSVYLAIMACNAILGLVDLPQKPIEYIGVLASFIWSIGLLVFLDLSFNAASCIEYFGEFGLA